MAKVTIEIPDEELWSSICGSGWEYNPWWMDGTHYMGNADWDKPGSLRLKIWDPESYNKQDNPTKGMVTIIGVGTLAKAYGEYLRLGYQTPLDDLDGTYGDVIMQLAVFGKVVYG